MGTKINKFFDTAVGKSLQTFLWTLGAYGLTIVVALIAKVHWNDQMIALGVPGLVNWLLYSAKVVIDKEVPTLPSSQPMMLVPKNNTVTTTTVVQPASIELTSQDAADKMSEALNNVALQTSSEETTTVAPVADVVPPIS